MKQTILGTTPALYQKRLRQRIALSIFITLLTVGLNILFTALRTDRNHAGMLLLNIGTDILAGLFLLPFITLRILPQSRLLRLMYKEKSQVTVLVESISSTTQRYMDMDCYCVSGTGRKCFLPAGTISLTENTEYTFFLVSNIIVEAVQ